MWQARGQFEPAADHGAVQRRDHRHRAVLHLLQRRVPHARMLQACAGVALLQLRQVEAGAEMRAFAVDHGGAHRGGQLLEGVAQREDQCVGQRVALGRRVQADDGDVAVEFELEVGVVVMIAFRSGSIMVMKNNQFKPRCQG